MRSAGHQGGVAQMVERSLSMREVPGSIPGISKLFSNENIFENRDILCDIFCFILMSREQAHGSFLV